MDEGCAPALLGMARQLHHDNYPREAAESRPSCAAHPGRKSPDYLETFLGHPVPFRFKQIYIYIITIIKITIDYNRLHK